MNSVNDAFVMNEWAAGRPLRGVGRRHHARLRRAEVSLGHANRSRIGGLDELEKWSKKAA